MSVESSEKEKPYEEVKGGKSIDKHLFLINNFHQSRNKRELL